MNTPIRRRLVPTAVLFLGALVASTEKTLARDLTFEDRVKAQEAIERVYYSHQVGAMKPFAEAVPPARLELKVRTYLKQSAALERFWRTPVTAEMLGQELLRMASATRMPDRLRELEAALGDDPFLIQETLARPVLVDRLTRNFFATDATLHDKERREADALREDLAQGRLDPRSEHPRRTVVEVARVEAVAGAEGIDAPALAGGKKDPSRIELRPDAFERYRALIPSADGEIGQVQEEREAFAIRAPLSKKEDTLRVATFIVRKQPWDEWWASVKSDLQETVEAVARPDVSLPKIQAERSEVFTDTTCPADETWDSRTLDGLLSPRDSHTTVWTGSVMVVWGGSNGGPLNTGGRYDPATDTWTATSTINAPAARYLHTAVWTGSVMIVWGGHSGKRYFENSGAGGLYEPVADVWTPMAVTTTPKARIAHTAIWTGSRMIVWGGYFLRHESPEPDIHVRTYYLNDGGQYDPDTDSWTAVTTVNAPSARTAHAAVWTGSLMVVWGGGANSYDSTGGRYDPATDTWTSTSMTNAPSARDGGAAVWTGSRMIVWGGGPMTPPEADTTPRPTPGPPRPRGRPRHLASGTPPSGQEPTWSCGVATFCLRVLTTSFFPTPGAGTTPSPTPGPPLRQSMPRPAADAPPSGLEAA
jgi:hypothetical protein